MKAIDGAPILVGQLVKQGTLSVYETAPYPARINETLYTIKGHNTESGDDIEPFELFMIDNNNLVLSDVSDVYDLYDKEIDGILQHRLVAVHISY